MHAKINRKKLDKLNIIKIWLLFNLHFNFTDFLLLQCPPIFSA